jgi:hypothetical protein
LVAQIADQPSNVGVRDFGQWLKQFELVAKVIPSPKGKRHLNRRTTLNIAL